MRRFLIPLLSLLLAVALLSMSALHISADNAQTEESIPDDAVITYGYLQAFKEQMKQEIIDELTASGGLTAETPYSDISATAGQFIIISADSELIYRGGGAVVVTSSANSGDGIKDMSTGAELFSGSALEYGHIYFAGESTAQKAVLITGDIAFFTVRGEYEII